MEGTILSVDPLRRLSLIWREPWFKNADVVLTFDLEPHGEESLLTLTQAFPADYDPHDYLAGWHEFMDALEGAMNGRPLVWNSPERKQAYAVREQTYKAVAAVGG